MHNDELTEPLNAESDRFKVGRLVPWLVPWSTCRAGFISRLPFLLGNLSSYVVLHFGSVTEDFLYFYTCDLHFFFWLELFFSPLLRPTTTTGCSRTFYYYETIISTKLSLVYFISSLFLHPMKIENPQRDESTGATSLSDKLSQSREFLKYKLGIPCS